MQLFVLLATLAAWSCYGALQLLPLRHLNLRVGESSVELVRSELRKDYVDYEARYRVKSHHKNLDAPEVLHIYYHSKEKGTVHLDSVEDPRVRIAESRGEGEKGTPGMPHFGDLLISVPEDARYVTVHRGHDLKGHTVEIPRDRLFEHSDKFKISSTGSSAPVSRLRDIEKLVGHPDHHKNIIFLPGGYNSTEKAKFKAAVRASALQFMGGDLAAYTNGLLVPAPWDRYMGLVNVYALWQESEESGATIPLKADGQPHPGYPAKEVNNNLDCSYGTSVIRFLGCSIPLMQKLAFGNIPATEKNSVVVTLVNADIYGGTGGGGYLSNYAGNWQECSSSTDCVPVCSNDESGCAGGELSYWKGEDGANKFIQVLIHELGHADSLLSDEYDYGVSTTRTDQLNCHYQESNPPWLHWIGHQLGVQNPSVDGGFCAYTGYYKPTPDLCLMQSDRAEFCAVCAEQVILSIYRDTESLVAPRCPQESETMVVVNNDDWHKLEVSDKFLDASQTQRDDGTIGVGWYGRAHDGTRSPYYTTCTDAAASGRKVRKITDVVPADQVLCVDSLNKIPLRRDDGDIPHKWVWPTSAASDPEASLTTQLSTGVTVAQPWNRNVTANNQWEMTGHVNWVTADDGVKGAITQVAFKGSQLGLGDHVFEFEVVDETHFVMKNAWQNDARVDRMSYKTTFRVRVVAASANYSHCTGDLALDSTAEDVQKCTTRVQAFPYCAICDEGAVCNGSYPYIPFEAQADVAGALKGFESLIFGVWGAVALGILAGVLFLWFVIGKCTENRIKEVVPFGKGLTLCRYWLMGFSGLLMLLSIGAISVCIYVYTISTLFVQAAVLGGAVASIILFLLSFVTFTSAMFRSRVQLVITGILLIIVVLGLIGTGIAMYVIAGKLEGEDVAIADGSTNATAASSDLVEFIVEFWNKQVIENPKAVCTFESTFSCSGMTASCHNKFHAQCPANCDITHLSSPNPCLDFMKQTWFDYYYPVGGGVFGFLCLMIIALVMNWTLCCCIRKRKNETKRRLVAVPEQSSGAHNDLVTVRIMRNLTADERQKLEGEFRKFDRNRDGAWDATEMQAFYKGCFGLTVPLDDIRKTMDRFDSDGNGTLSFPEFQKVCYVKEGFDA